MSFEYDPYIPEFQDDPYAVYQVLRDRSPVYRNEERGFWALSRFEDVWNAVHDPETFSSVVDEATTLLPMMIYMDPPRHDELRALVSRAFTPRRIAEIESFVRRVAVELLDRVAEHGNFDVIHDYAAPLPSTVIGELIGVPRDQQPEFRGWAEALVETDPEAAAPSPQAAANIYRLFAELLAERRARPGDDLMSALLAAEIDGRHLTEEELLGFCFLLIVAGNDTTTNLIGNGTYLLAHNPDQRARLVEDPGRIAGAAEEMLRYEPPAQALPRTATRDVELHGQRIPAGDRVLLVWASANHDDREFPDPERFDVTRRIDRHLGLGHGAHYCLGNSLARLETRVAFEELLTRFPDYNLETDSPRRITSSWARAFAALPVRATPARVGA